MAHTDNKQITVGILSDAIASLNHALTEELDKKVLAGNINDLMESTPMDLSSRYWLMQFLEPLSRKELKSVVDGFLVQLLNEEQAKKLVKFLLVRFPNYYEENLNSLQTEGLSTPEELKELTRKEKYPVEKFQEIKQVDIESEESKRKKLSKIAEQKA